MRLSKRKRRVAISDILGSLIMVAVTLVAGSAVFGFVNGQAGVSESQYGQAVANNVNYLREHYVIVNTQFGGCSASGGNRYCNQVLVSIYNNGNVGFTPNSIRITNATVKISSGTTVPQVYVVATKTATNAYRNTGTGLPGGCTIATSTGGPYVGATPVAQNVAPPTIFTISLPSCISTAGSSILVGASYQIQILGTFGYIVQMQVTASG